VGRGAAARLGRAARGALAAGAGTEPRRQIAQARFRRRLARGRRSLASLGFARTAWRASQDRIGRGPAFALGPREGRRRPRRRNLGAWPAWRPRSDVRAAQYGRSGRTGRSLAWLAVRFQAVAGGVGLFGRADVAADRGPLSRSFRVAPRTSAGLARSARRAGSLPRVGRQGGPIARRRAGTDVRREPAAGTARQRGRRRRGLILAGPMELHRSSA